MSKLLLLDDEPTALEWMAAAMTSMGHEVHSYQSGREALADVTSWHPDLVVSDLLMPEMDGFAFARLVRAHGGPPVMFISIATQREEAVLAGAVGYVQKPATAGEVRAEVERVLGHHGGRSAILVVEDDDATRELYRMFLEPQFDVVEAEDGAIALALLRERSFDLVITDINMPNMNGVELIRAIRADPKLEEIPIIVETSDRSALSSSVWCELKITHKMDKLECMRWLRGRINDQLESALERDPST